MKFRTFALTVRPRDGITDDEIGKFVKWMKKNSKYYHAVTEKTGHERHLHAGFILAKERTRSNVLQMVMQLFNHLTPAEKSVLRSGLKIMYNWDYVNNYLDKDDDTVILESCLPESGHLESFFPPKPVANEVKAKKCSLYYHELEAMWYKYCTPGTEISTLTTRDFLFRMMYSERVLPVIRDDKQIVQVSRHLTRWLNRVEHSTIELPPFEKEE